MNEVIKQFFGDPYIKLSCPLSGECLYYKQVPGYEPPELRQGFPLVVLFFFGIGFLILTFGVLSGLVHLRKRAESGRDGYVPVDTEDEDDEARRMQDMMAHHTPCIVMFRNTNYTIETSKKAITPSDPANNSVSLSAPISYQQQVVLEGIQGMIRPGEVMAIMGGSSRLIRFWSRKDNAFGYTS